MLDKNDLRKIGEARLHDAQMLLDGERYEGAIYLCGYAVELALKARICRTLKWPGYPSTRSEFQNYSSFKTHSLVVLLRLSGQEDKIKTKHFAEWSAVAKWNPESRYNPIGTAKLPDAELMLASARELLKIL